MKLHRSIFSGMLCRSHRPDSFSWRSGIGFRVRHLATLCVVGLAVLAPPPPARAFTLFDHQILTGHNGTGSLGFSDIFANPNDHWAWDPTSGSTITITFKFDATFNALFTNPSIHDQVRLALKQWDTADVVPYGTQDTYLRNTPSPGVNSFIDIRTVTVHEVGHVLGFGHPNQGVASGRNYRRVPGGNSVDPLSAQANTTFECMHAFAASGMCNHILSWDEKDAFDRSYAGRNINFVEVGIGAPADIIFQGYHAVSGNIAKGVSVGTLRNAGAPLLGTRVTGATVCFNIDCVAPIGYRRHGVNWDIVCNSLTTHSISIRTRGTDNLVPFGTWDNPGPHAFSTPTHTAVGPNVKDDITHRWTIASTSTDVPAGTMFHPGISLDVFDWTVVNAVAFDAAFNPCVVAIPSMHDWSNDGVTGFDPAAVGEEMFVRTNHITARGFIITTSEAPLHRLSNLKLADVTGRKLELGDLNRPVLNELQRAGQIMNIENFGQRTIGPKDFFLVVLEGEAADLPPLIRERGNFLLLKRPDLLDKELFAYVESENDETKVGTFALIGSRPIVALAEGPRLRIERGREGGVRVFWPASVTGFTLQSSSRLLPTDWVNVDAPVSIAGDEQFVTLPSDKARTFYRLFRQ